MTKLLLAWLPLLAALFAVSGCAAKSRWYEDATIVRGQDDDEGIAIGSDIGKSWWNRVSGGDSSKPQKRFPWSKNVEKSEQAARVAFQQAEANFQAKKFNAARGKYEEAAARFPDSPIQEDAMFMIGECYFFADDYTLALNAYEQLMTKYKRSRHLDTTVVREFAIGRYWMEREMKDPSWRLLPNWGDDTRPTLDTQGKAMRALEKVRLNHPTGPLADDSMMATATFYFSRERYSDADYFFTQLRREYPNSEHVYEASVLGIQSKIRTYEGPQYDGTALVEARELIEDTLKQFPNISPEDRQRLMTLYAQVNQSLAQRDFHMGEFYEGKGYHRAASVYYNRLISEYPQTQLAAKARERVGQAAMKPIEPERRFTWISSLFPDDHPDLRPNVATAAAGGNTTQR